MARAKAEPRLVDPAAGTGAVATPGRQNRQNLFQLAYDQLEERLVTCALRPGARLTIEMLQEMTGLGRTPIHTAVNRLAADTLIHISPRHGLQIAPIDLARERVLLHLRRDVERFVMRLAAERASMSHRNQMLHLERALRSRQADMSVSDFNVFDRRIDQVILAAAGEPFLEHTLRPLHTIFRRIGFIHHTYMPGQTDLDGTVEHHLAVLNAVAHRHVDAAVAASDALIGFIETMFDGLEAGIDPRLLDCSIEPLFPA